MITAISKHTCRTADLYAVRRYLMIFLCRFYSEREVVFIGIGRILTTLINGGGHRKPCLGMKEKHFNHMLSLKSPVT